MRTNRYTRTISLVTAVWLGLPNRLAHWPPVGGIMAPASPGVCFESVGWIRVAERPRKQAQGAAPYVTSLRSPAAICLVPHTVSGGDGREEGDMDAEIRRGSSRVPSYSSSVGGGGGTGG